jgi:hypothetical protein
LLRPYRQSMAKCISDSALETADYSRAYCR